MHGDSSKEQQNILEALTKDTTLSTKAEKQNSSTKTILGKDLTSDITLKKIAVTEQPSKTTSSK